MRRDNRSYAVVDTEAFTEFNYPTLPSPTRLSHARHLFSKYVFPGLHIISPRSATKDELCKIHTTKYVDAVESVSKSYDYNIAAPHRLNGINTRVFDDLYASEILRAGSSLVAARSVVEGAWGVMSFSGGRHHAHPNYASGYCYFNDIALAIQEFVEEGWRVAYVDIDAHHGDGVQDIFYDDVEILTISVHESPAYSFPGTGSLDEVGQGLSAVNVPLLPKSGDAQYLYAWDRIVVPKLIKFSPDVIVLQAGVDAHMDDPLGQLRLSSYTYEYVAASLRKLDIPWVMLGGGGYESSLTARMWVLMAATLMEQRIGVEHNFAAPCSATVVWLWESIEETVKELRDLHGL